MADKTETMIGTELVSLPVSYLIGSTLAAVVDAQTQSALAEIDFIKNIGFDGNGLVKTVDFKYDKQVQTKNGLETSTGTITAPILSIVDVPYIRVKECRFHLDFKITDTVIDQTYDSKVASSGGNIGWKMFSAVRFDGKIVSTQKHKQDTYKESNLTIDVLAVQDKMPSGLSNIINILTESMAVDVKQPTASNDQESKNEQESSSE